MNSYLLTLDRFHPSGQPSKLLVAVVAPTAQDALTVVEVAFASMPVRALQCLAVEFVRALPDWKQTELQRRGHVELDHNDGLDAEASDARARAGRRRRAAEANLEKGPVSERAALSEPLFSRKGKPHA